MQDAVTILGLGYVGFPTAMHFAESGVKVYGFDVNEKLIEKLKEGQIPYVEMKKEYELKRYLKEGLFVPTEDLKGAMEESRYILIIVPTPVKPDKTPDLRYVINAGELVYPHLKQGHLVVLESTVYPGVTEEVLKPILEKSGLRTPEDFGLAYAPERYNPGDPEHTIENIARIVGGITPQWAEEAKRLYDRIIKKGVTVVKDIKTAEAAKVIENIQRDLNIALMNELALIFERMGIDIMDVIEAASTKWNFNVYWPGAGVGGHCLPVDPYYLVKKAEELGYHSKIITAGRSINDYMPEHMFHLTLDALNEMGRAVKGSVVAVFGYSYKENVGDGRETPADKLIDLLLKYGAEVRVVDPFIGREGLPHYTDPYTSLEGADALVLVTPHDAFKELDLDVVKKKMRTSIIIDGRRIFDPEEVERRGMLYKGVGWGRNPIKWDGESP